MEVVKGLELSERTIIDNPAIRKIFNCFFNSFKRQTKKPNGMPSKPKLLGIEHVRTARKKVSSIVGCIEAYNCDQYDYLKSQICEQKNRSLRKLSSILAYCDFENYKTKIKLFFTINNLEEKGMM